MARKYTDARPPIPADLRRAVSVESGHACAIARCGEHTYLEIHHINGNRGDNRQENLILLCDKHHKMAHAGIIDRMAVAEYKAALRREHHAALAERVARLEELLKAHPAPGTHDFVARVAQATDGDAGIPTLSYASGAQLSALTLEQLALTRFERQRMVSLFRGVQVRSGDVRLQLDALFRAPEGQHDLVVEVRWLRKRYLDAPVWARQVAAATDAYSLFTGRPTRGVLIFVTPARPWAKLAQLDSTSQELSRLENPPEVVIYNYDELGFTPAAISADLLRSTQTSSSSNDQSPDNAG
jgi:hypothetical protein